MTHPFVDVLGDLLNRPVVLILLVGLFFLLALRHLKLDFPTFVTSVNSIGSQPFALIVMVIGFWMLIQSKKAGIDTTIAGAVIGVASNMLQAQIKDATHPPPGSAVKSSTTTEFQTPIDPSTLENAAILKQPTTFTGRAYQK
jgi:hypothetical protein